METRDIALTGDKDGNVIAHRADCPVARKQAEQGRPVITMFGCTAPLPPDVTRHKCLESR